MSSKGCLNFKFLTVFTVHLKRVKYKTFEYYLPLREVYSSSFEGSDLSDPSSSHIRKCCQNKKTTIRCVGLKYAFFSIFYAFSKRNLQQFDFFALFSINSILQLYWFFHNETQSYVM